MGYAVRLDKYRRTRSWLDQRNEKIRKEYKNGETIQKLSYWYCLSEAWIAILVDPDKHYKFKESQRKYKKRLGRKRLLRLLKRYPVDVVLELTGVTLEEMEEAQNGKHNI